MLRVCPQAHRRCAVRMLCYSKYGSSQLSDVEIRPLPDRVAQVLLDFRKAVQPGSSGQMAPAQGKDQSIHATADLDLENDPRTKHKVRRCSSLPALYQRCTSGVPAVYQRLSPSVSRKDSEPPTHPCPPLVPLRRAS